MTTLEREQLFHDEQAIERAVSFQSGCASLRFDDEIYLDHESWIRPAFAQLGSLKNKVALDFGCGHGMASVVMARAGAEVHPFDLSPGYVREVEERAEANGVTVNAVIANGEELPYPDEQFDAIWGCAILHHLDFAKAAAELRRVLKPGGVAVFCEPWGGNPMLNFARRFLPYPGKHRTPDECPMVERDVAQLRIAFPNLKVDGHQFFAMLRRVSPSFSHRLRLEKLDRFLFARIPLLEKWSRYVVLNMTKG